MTYIGCNQHTIPVASVFQFQQSQFQFRQSHSQKENQRSWKCVFNRPISIRAGYAGRSWMICPSGLASRARGKTISVRWIGCPRWWQPGRGRRSASWPCISIRRSPRNCMCLAYCGDCIAGHRAAIAGGERGLVERAGPAFSAGEDPGAPGR